MPTPLRFIRRTGRPARLGSTRFRPLVAALALAACDTLPNGETTDLCTADTPHADCEQCRTVPRAAECPQCQGASPDRDCEDATDGGGADGSGGGGPLPLVDGQVPGGGAGASDAGDAGGTGGDGDGGGTGGIGGNSGAGGTGACTKACAGATPLCDDKTGECVACRDDDDCDGATPHCASATHACVECVKHADCDGATPKCDDTYQCVECLAHADCDDAAAAKCDTSKHECAKCTADAQCAHLSGTTLCDEGDGECVECTGTEYAACGEDSGTPLVCDSLTRECTTKKERSTGLCQSCVSDAQCNLGQLCVMQQFGAPAQDVGHFCFWRKNAGVGGAPAACSTARPFVDTVMDAVSIDDVTADVCGLRVTTCVGYADYSNPSTNCEIAPNTTDDSLCGATGLDDAYCRYFDDDGLGDNFYRCTMPCLSDDDCPCVGPSCSGGVMCDKSGLNWMCDL